MNDLTPLRLKPAKSAALTVEIVQGMPGFLALAADWNELFDRAGAPHQLFQSHAFLSAWAASYAGSGSDLLTLTVRSGRQLVAIVPLFRRQRFGLTFLQFMGAPVAQFDDMVLDPAVADAALPLLARAVEGLGADFLQARRLRADGAFWHMDLGHATVFETLESPFADLAKRVAGDQPGQAYSSKDRSNIRRRLRRLSERGDLALRSYGPGVDALPLAARAVQMKKAALKREGVYSRAIGRAHFEDFFRRIAIDPAGGLLVSTIELDGKPIGIDLSFLCKEQGYGHVLATDGEYDKEGIGQMLVHHVFAQAKTAGAEIFDLLAPADPYKLRHADGVTRVESRVHAFTGRGRIAARLAFGLALPIARKLAHRLPAWIIGRS